GAAPAADRGAAAGQLPDRGETSVGVDGQGEVDRVPGAAQQAARGDDRVGVLDQVRVTFVAVGPQAGGQARSGAVEGKRFGVAEGGRGFGVAPGPAAAEARVRAAGRGSGEPGSRGRRSWGTAG